MSEIKSQIYLWDSPQKVSFSVSQNETILLWQQFTIDNDKNIFSVPDLIDKDSDYLRAKYLKWISQQLKQPSASAPYFFCAVRLLCCDSKGGTEALYFSRYTTFFAWLRN